MGNSSNAKKPDSEQIKNPSKNSELSDEWIKLVEQFLQENTKKCFWAKPFLDYFRSLFTPIRFTDPISSKLVYLNKNIQLIHQMINDTSKPQEIQPDSSPITPNTTNLRYLIESILKNIKLSENPFNKLIVEFRKFFISEFVKKLSEYNAGIYADYKSTFASSKTKTQFSPKKRDEHCSTTKIALNNIQIFIKLIAESLAVIFESQIQNAKLAKFKELILIRLVDFVIDIDVYEIIFMLIRLEDQAEEVLIDKKIKELRFTRPECLGVDPAFCLAGISSYQNAVNKLHEITKQMTVSQKFEAINELSQVVCDCIDTYWKKEQFKKPVMTADHFLSLLIFLVVESHVPNLFTHVAVANELAQLGAKTSYCLNSLWACFYHLLNVEPKYVVLPNASLQAGDGLIQNIPRKISDDSNILNETIKNTRRKSSSK